MNQTNLRGHKWRLTALAIAINACLFSGSVFAQQSAGSVSGRAAKGDTITVENKATNISRTVKASDDGAYQINQLPAGSYVITVKRGNGATETLNVDIAPGEGTVANFSTQLDKVQVSGSRILTLDTKSAESSTTLSAAQLERLPVAKDVTSVTLLAPGATKGDGRLGQTGSRNGNIPSLGGASPAENAYYVNGFNVTNIVNGVAFNQVPFEGIASQQVKTGGYSAEFGRSLGGVVSVTTKRGTNEWHGGANMSYSPSALSGSSVYAEREPDTGAWKLRSRDGGTDETKYNFWMGGPLIEDKLFIFGLFSGTNLETDTYAATRQTLLKNDTPQYLIKVDWNVNQNNLFEFTAFNDKSKDKVTEWKSPTPFKTEKGDLVGTSTYESGGDNMIAKWTSWINEDLSVAAMYGVGKYSRRSNDAGAACPIVQDRRTSTTKSLGCWTGNGMITDPNANDKREAFRLDAEWALGKHTLRAGLDNETYSVVDGSAYSGGGLYQVRVLNPGQTLANGYTNTGSTPIEYVRYRHLENGGTFKTKNSAWYLEDNYQVTDNVLATIGIRNESFKNMNANGQAFIKVDDTWAPRLGVVWDITGKADMKLFANLGRYYIPVYANTNVRLSGAEYDYQEFYRFGGSFSNDRFQAPSLGEQLGGRAVTSNGETPDPRSVVDPNIKPMYQDEFIAGFQKALSDGWSVGVKYTHRKLKNGMDDICNDEGPYNWALGAGYSEDQAAAIGNAVGHCFLYNPGGNLTANLDLDGTGQLSTVVIPASALMMPKPKRTYDALEFSFERSWDKKWMLQGSYVLAFSKGNTEGYVKSDIGQDDAGISQDFDYPGLMEGADGYLPNDRRHTFKVFGAYQLNNEWRFGANLVVQSGRPKNCFGVYGGDLDGVSQLYGDASFWCGGQLHPRGTIGRLQWTKELSLQANYRPEAIKGLSLTLDILNVFNARGVRAIEEAEGSGMDDPNSTYGQPLLSSLQRPRTVKFTAQYEF